MPDYSSLHQAIIEWYHTHGRLDLPWRNTHDPYAIYLSEIMLQQTQVKTVLERFYFPFLERFPTLQSLAEAPLEDVLKKWEGLGYYTRARNLHNTACQTAPKLPENFEGLIALPGIGRNTAHAILAFAHHQAYPVMEANVKRILCRFFGIKTIHDKTLWETAFQLLDKNNPFVYNQAMMDIGATICTPKNPQCNMCPLSKQCQGKATPELYPLPKKKKAEKIRHKAIVVYQNQQQEYYIYQRSSRFLHGLYGFFEYETLPEHLLSSAENLGSIKHVYSHFTLKTDVFITSLQPDSNEGLWINKNDFEQLAFSKADHKVMQLLLNSIN